MMLLGWSPGPEEVVDLRDAVKRFSIKKLNKTPAVFSLEKLAWLNGEHIKRKEPASIAEALVPFLKEKAYIGEDFDRKRLESVVKLFQNRMPTLKDFVERADFIFVDKPSISLEEKVKYLTDDKKKPFALLAGRFNALEEFDASSTEEAFRRLVEELGLKGADLVHPVRVALTGKTIGPGLFDTMAVLGKEKTVRRLKEAFTH